MTRQKWLLINAMMLLIMSSMYVGAFVSKHEQMRDKGVTVDIYRGSKHEVKRIVPKSQRIRVWPWVSVDYDM